MHGVPVYSPGFAGTHCAYPRRDGQAELILKGREGPDPQFCSGGITIFKATKCKILPSQHHNFFSGALPSPQHRPYTMNLFNLKFMASVQAFQTHTFCVVKLFDLFRQDIFSDKAVTQKDYASAAVNWWISLRSHR